MFLHLSCSEMKVVIELTVSLRVVQLAQTVALVQTTQMSYRHKIDLKIVALIMMHDCFVSLKS